MGYGRSAEKPRPERPMITALASPPTRLHKRDDQAMQPGSDGVDDIDETVDSEMRHRILGPGPDNRWETRPSNSLTKHYFLEPEHSGQERGILRLDAPL